MAWLAHRRDTYDGQTTAWLAKSVLGSLRGHRPTKHSPSDRASQTRVEPPPEAFDARLPPRYLAFEGMKVFVRVQKLDSSTPHFAQSRTLAVCQRKSIGRAWPSFC